MPAVVHIIGATIVFNITVIVVVPAYWPSLIKPEPVATVVEAVIPADHLGAPHAEVMVVPEVGIVVGVGNAAIVAVVTVVFIPSVTGIRLCLFAPGWL